MEKTGFGKVSLDMEEPGICDDSEPGGQHEFRREEATVNEKLLLTDIHPHPGSPVTERYERTGLNAYQGNKAKDSLIGKGLVVVKDLPTEKGRIKLLQIVEPGRQALEAQGASPNRSHRKGGPEHEYWKKKLAEEYRSEGWRVVEEYAIGGGKTVDLACFRDGRRVAVEVETGKSHMAYNLKRCLEAGFDEVRSVKI